MDLEAIILGVVEILVRFGIEGFDVYLVVCYEWMGYSLMNMVDFGKCRYVN